MKQLKIRTKFILLGIAGTFALMYIVYLTMNISKLGLVSVDKVYQDSRQVQNIQQNFIVPIFYLRELSLSLVVAPNDQFRLEINKQIEPYIIKLDKRFSKMDTNLRLNWENYKKLLRVTQNFIKEGFEEGAFLNVNKDEHEKFYVLIQSLQKIQNKELLKSSETFQNVKTTIVQNRFFILLVSTLLGVFMALLAWFILSKISNAIEQVKLGHKRFFSFLKHHETNEIMGIDLDTNDELGDMARTINQEMKEAKESLKQDMLLIESATSMLEQIKEGKLKKRLYIEASSLELNTLKSVINEMLDNLEEKIQKEIDERLKQEQILIQQSKLAAMGEMIGNIAHQWRQPLGEINAILMNIETRYKFKDFNEKFIENSVEECNLITRHMSNTINDFQSFFKPSKVKEVFNIVDACFKADSILKASFKNHNIKYICNFDKKEKVLGYPNEFSQAFLNILSNAKDALIQRKIKEPFIEVRIKTGKKYVLIKVEDNAGGIKKEHLTRIFEPYFSTKHAKQGTGIGLYMCKTIIENNMNGIITVKNINEGACFTIKLKKFYKIEEKM